MTLLRNSGKVLGGGAAAVLLAATASLVTLSVASPRAGALLVQEAGTNVAVVDPTAVFAQMKERESLERGLAERDQAYSAERQTRQTAIQEMQRQLNEIKRGTPEFQAAEDKLIDELATFEAFAKREQFKLEAEARRVTGTLYRKITAATADVAEKQGFDVVLTADRPDPANMGQLSLDQYREVLRSRRIVYTSDAADITDAVLLAVDADFAGQ